MSEIKIGDYISKKDFLKENDSIVAYALYVLNNIKKDDYVRPNTGEIVRVLYIKENKVDKKAIYFGIYDEDWFTCSAVENFSANIIDLIEEGDYVNGKLIHYVLRNPKNGETMICYGNGKHIDNKHIKSVVTKEQFKRMEYKV